MTPEAVAHAYVACIELEEKMRLEVPELAEQMDELRGELHALLMLSFKESGIPFVDRADAARLAFEIVRKPALK